MSVEEALNAPVTDAGNIVTADTPNEISDNDAVGAIWDKYERDNGSARDTNTGRFTSASGEAANGDVTASTGPLEGGEGGEPTTAETSTPAVKVPLPANWTGLDDHWSKIPAEAQEAIATNQKKLHQTLSDQGRLIASYKPVTDVFGEFKEYFGGDRGNYKPDEAVRYLFGLQRSMDDKPLETLLQIADTYQLRQQLAQALGSQGGEPAQQTDHTQALLAEISQLKRSLAGLADPSKIDERISTKLNEERQQSAIEKVIEESRKDMPLYDQVPEADIVYFIQKVRLSDSAAPHDAVLKKAYDMAVNADPDLRKKAAALSSAATLDPKLVENAKKANATNIRSTSSGKAREMTEDESLEAIWEKHKRA